MKSTFLVLQFDSYVLFSSSACSSNTKQNYPQTSHWIYSIPALDPISMFDRCHPSPRSGYTLTFQRIYAWAYLPSWKQLLLPGAILPFSSSAAPSYIFFGLPSVGIFDTKVAVKKLSTIPDIFKGSDLFSEKLFFFFVVSRITMAH